MNELPLYHNVSEWLCQNSNPDLFETKVRAAPQSGQCCPVGENGLYLCVQCGSQYPHVTSESFKCGWLH